MFNFYLLCKLYNKMRINDTVINNTLNIDIFKIKKKKKHSYVV